MRRRKGKKLVKETGKVGAIYYAKWKTKWYKVVVLSHSPPEYTVVEHPVPGKQWDVYKLFNHQQPISPPDPGRAPKM